VTATVHATAVVSPRAELGEDVEVGPYAVIGDEVRVGARTRIGAHASLQGPATIGRENRIFDHALLGGEPQDVRYRGEPTRLIVGDRNVFREFSTVHRGTPTGRAETTVGSDNYFMAYTHVAHDCRVGSQCVFANYAALAGHIEVGDGVVLGAFSGFHQFVRIGAYAFVGAYTMGRQDVLPFCRTDGVTEPKTYGLNLVGLRRSGFSEERLEALQKAYRFLRKSKLNTTQALERMEAELAGQPDVEQLVRFIRESKRGFHK
jgi:UDP-N-acetylglucosamine acyltransferase